MPPDLRLIQGGGAAAPPPPKFETKRSDYEHHTHHLYHHHYPQLCKYTYVERERLSYIQDLADYWCKLPSHYLRAAAMYQKYHPKREASGFWLGGYQSIEAVWRKDCRDRDESFFYYYFSGQNLLKAADDAEAQGR